MYLRMINILKGKKYGLTENHITRKVKLQDKKRLLHGIGEGK